MTAVVVFGAVELSNPSPKMPSTDIRSDVKILLAGTQKVFTTSFYGELWKFSCQTRDYGEIAELIDLIGTSTTLTIDGITLGYYYNIVQLVPNEITPLVWEYTVEFEKSGPISMESR